MELEIISPDGVLFKGEVNQVSFPGMAGSFEVLPHHAPLITALRKGNIRYETGDGTIQEIEVKDGFVEVKNDSISACIENFIAL